MVIKWLSYVKVIDVSRAQCCSLLTQPDSINKRALRDVCGQKALQETYMKEMEILGKKKIPKATWEHVVFGVGLSIETCVSSIPELLGEMLCLLGSTYQE